MQMMNIKKQYMKIKIIFVHVCFPDINVVHEGRIPYYVRHQEVQHSMQILNIGQLQRHLAR